MAKIDEAQVKEAMVEIAERLTKELTFDVSSTAAQNAMTGAQPYPTADYSIDVANRVITLNAHNSYRHFIWPFRTSYVSNRFIREINTRNPYRVRAQVAGIKIEELSPPTAVAGEYVIHCRLKFIKPKDHDVKGTVLSEILSGIPSEYVVERKDTGKGKKHEKTTLLISSKTDHRLCEISIGNEFTRVILRSRHIWSAGNVVLGDLYDIDPQVLTKRAIHMLGVITNLNKHYNDLARSIT